MRDRLALIRERVLDGKDHEWGWYQDDVPYLFLVLAEKDEEIAGLADSLAHARERLARWDTSG